MQDLLEKLKGWKFHISMLGIALLALVKWLDGGMSTTELIEALLGCCTGSSARSALTTEIGRFAEKLGEKIKENGKDAAAILLIALIPFGAIGCCGGAAAEVKELRLLHASYRQKTVPDPKLTPQEKKDVEEIAREFDQAFDKLEKLVE